MIGRIQYILHTVPHFPEKESSTKDSFQTVMSSGQGIAYEGDIKKKPKDLGSLAFAPVS